MAPRPLPSVLTAEEIEAIEAEAVERFPALYASMEVVPWLRSIDPAIVDPAAHLGADWVHYDLTTAAADRTAPPPTARHSTLICTTLRTGSTLLGESLNGIPGFGCPCEYFMEDAWQRLYSRWSCRDFREYGRALLAHRTDDAGGFGAKLFWMDGPALLDGTGRTGLAATLRSGKVVPGTPVAREMHREIHAAIAELLPAPRYLHLSRDDRLAQAVSTLVAAQVGSWRSMDVQSSPPQPRYSFNGLLALVGWFARFERHWTAFFADNCIEPQRLRYEDLRRDLVGSVARIVRSAGGALDEAKRVELERPRLREQAGETNRAMAARFLDEWRSRR